ncbi:MAG: hypothetical protein OEU86_00730, partial [Gammaproteobacteria bacterium]|nr:hypothetical protein [Gammaproteobacteria bacterium]
MTSASDDQGSFESSRVQNTKITSISWPDDLAHLHRLNPDRYPALLESTADQNPLGRYDILFAFPQGRLTLNSEGRLSGHCSNSDQLFLEALDQWWELEKSLPVQSSLPFTGGWFVLLGYELANQIEPGLNLQTDANYPVAMAVRCPAAIIRDRQKQCAW